MPVKTEMPTPFPISKAAESETIPAVARDVDVSALLDPDALLLQLSSEEKIKLLSGDDMWHTVPVSRLGIPRVRMSDGPNGVRGTAWTNGAASACFPCATGLAASFDVDLGRSVGEALGKECRARGVHCLLGPTTNIQRHPCGGRGFESFSEDPTLAGLMAEAWVNGVQSQKVMTTPKRETPIGLLVTDADLADFVANEQEFHRRSNDSVIDLRTLHEIYLEPFRLQCRAKPVAFMTSYNRVNGLHVAEDPWLLRDILRKEFGLGEGLIMSDWSGTYSSSDAIKASLDLEMPGPAFVRGVCVERDVVGGKLKPSDVDECVGRILKFVRHAQESGIPFEAKEGTIDTPEVHNLLQKAADASIVLLKNESNVLPVTPAPGLKIAVIGSNAKTPPYAGGGSANLLPTYTVTPLQAIEKVAAGINGTVQWEMGVDTARWTPLLTDFLSLSDKVEEASIVRAEFFDVDPWTNPSSKPLFAKENNSAFTYFIDGIPKEVPVRGYISLKTSFTPTVSGPWELGLGVAGQADLYVNGEKVIDNTTDQKAGLLFFTTGAEERTALYSFEAGRVYALEVRFSNFKPLSAQSPYTGRRGGIRIGGRPVRSAQDEIAKAVELAKASDVTIVVVGTTTEWESEAYDRDDMNLPGATDDLVRSILQAVPNAIIVNQSGMPVESPWLDQAPTLLQAFFGGNECGTAIANAIFGKSNPGGKLPVTWPVSLDDYKHVEFGNAVTTVYTEGLNVGYRWFDAPGRPKSAFPFGFGGSYTTFQFSNPKLISSGDCQVVIAFDIKNTGKLAGSTVGQVYVHQARPSVEKPDVELAGFAKLYLEPGESKTTSVTLDHKAFSYYNVRRVSWVAEAGDYEIRIGTSSRDIVLTRPFHLEESWTWTGLRAPRVL